MKQKITSLEQEIDNHVSPESAKYSIARLEIEKSRTIKSIELANKNLIKTSKEFKTLKKEFEKNTNLMLDGFTFSVAIPGHLRNTNATFISENDNTIYWEFDFNDIATNHFNMYAHSIVINNLSIQLFLLIILLVFIGFLWKKRSKKE